MGELPGILGISRPIELKLLDFLTSRLDRELISHNTIMAGHKKGVDDVLQKGHELPDVSFFIEEREDRA